MHGQIYNDLNVIFPCLLFGDKLDIKGATSITENVVWVPGVSPLKSTRFANKFLIVLICFDIFSYIKSS